MKRNWISGITAGAVIAVLTLFLGLQYNWLTQASEAERERLRKRIAEDVKRIAADFNREIQGAYFNFKADPAGLAAGDASELRDRYSYWAKNTEFPELIRGVFFVEEGITGSVSRFDPASGNLTKEDLTPETLSIVEYIASGTHPDPFFETRDALLVPLFREEKKLERILIRRSAPRASEEVVEIPKPAGYMVVQLDRAAIREKLLPAIIGRHITSGEYTIATVDREGKTIYQTAAITGEPDAEATLFDLAPDKLVFFSDRETLPGKQGATDIFNRTIENRTISSDKNDSPSNTGQTFTIQMRADEGQRHSAVITDTKVEISPWKLQAQHTAGSIDQFIVSERNRSIAIGLAVFLALVAGILAIVISAQRSWNFAQRQIDFVSSVSHEFRTPLAVIYSASENLADGVAKDREQVARYGDLIKEEGKKLSAMVEQILEFAGARSGKRRYRFEPVNIADVVRNALTDSNSLFSKAGFEVEDSIPDHLEVPRADPAALTAAITNLIQNSVKYSNGKRWLSVTVLNGEGNVKIEVEDRGIGISKTDQRRIFEPFFRSKEVVDAQIHGNGLGLSLVKEIVEEHRGSISVESEIGQGSKFILSIPRK